MCTHALHQDQQAKRWGENKKKIQTPSLPLSTLEYHKEKTGCAAAASASFMGKSTRCAHRLVAGGQVSRALSRRRTLSSFSTVTQKESGGKKEKEKRKKSTQYARQAWTQATIFFLLPYSQQPFALSQLSPYTHSRHHTAAQKKGQLVPPQVTHLLSLSRVSSVSVRSKQLPALGPSYGRKERTQALSHSSHMRTHCRRVTKRELKGSEGFKNR